MLRPMLKHVPRKHVLEHVAGHVPNGHVLGFMHEHLLRHIPKHVPDRYVVGTVLGYVAYDQACARQAESVRSFPPNFWNFF